MERKSLGKFETFGRPTTCRNAKSRVAPAASLSALRPREWRSTLRTDRSPTRTHASRAGCFIGTSVGAAEYLAENHAVFLEKGIRRVPPLFPALSFPGVVATQLAITL